VEVAQWLEEYAAAAAKALARVNSGKVPEERRLYEDVSIQCGLGRFFALKLRAGVLYGIFERTGDRAALAGALKAYRAARDGWSEFANRAKSVYVADITVGERRELRGHWLAVSKTSMATSRTWPPNSRALPRVSWNERRRSRFGGFGCGPAFDSVVMHLLNVFARANAGRRNRCRGRAAVRLHYRHVNHAERWEAQDMQAGDDRHRAAIPARYTDSPYPLEYYFELRDAPDRAWLYPGFNSDRTNPPYFVVRQG
jgi:hypothetical protein